LATWWDVLNYAKKTNKFDKKTLASVEEYLNNPIDWSNKNGGK
jgi:orotate phosphoribosyltransferase